MFSDFATWLGEPEAYNWITLGGAIAALLTAFFTGYTACLTWRDRRQTVLAEWHEEYSGGTFVVHCKITNNTDHTLTGERVKILGPVSEMAFGPHPKDLSSKHESWASNEAGVRLTLEPRQAATISFIVVPDASRLLQVASSWRRQPRFLLAKAAWSTLRWRVGSGVKFSTLVMLRRRSSRTRPIRLTHIIRMHPPHAIKIAETIEKKAAAT